MNKKETAAFEQLKHELRLAKAFNWTEPVAPDVAPPTSWDKLSTGFLFTAYSGFGGDSVCEACSSSIHHARGRTDKTTTQGKVWVYSSMLLALKALRHEVEKVCAERLAAIDFKIEQELNLAINE